MQLIMRITLLLPLLALVLTFTACSEQVEQKSRPNIVFIMSDDHAYQAISAYRSVGAEGLALNETPNFDRLADEGMRFDNCYVTNSICGPCRAVIQTGKP